MINVLPVKMDLFLKKVSVKNQPLPHALDIYITTMIFNVLFL